MSRWLAGRLGGAAPELLVIPNPLPAHAAGPVTARPEDLRHRRPARAGEAVRARRRRVLAHPRAGARLDAAIWGDGPRADNLAAQVRKLGLEDRVELPGSTARHGGRVGPHQRRRARLAGRGLPARAAGGDVGGRAAGVVRLPVRAARDHHPRRRRAARAAGVQGRAGRRDAAHRHRRRPAHRLGAAALARSERWDGQVLARQWVETFRYAVARRADPLAPRRVLHGLRPGPLGDLPETTVPPASRPPRRVRRRCGR